MEDTKIWDTFVNKAREKHLDKEVAMVKEKVESAISNLELIRDTFPTYTLHNAKHSQNVLRLMGELLGDQIEKITPLEGAILILAAYYHDIGMVFKEELRNNLEMEPDFKSFTRQYPGAFVKIHNNNKQIPYEVAEWYCRWIHPKRSAIFIDNDIRWEGTSLKTALSNVCLSHGENVDYLLNDNAVDTNFLANADLKFCALLLRLADILDFDNSRSPIEIYDYTGIANRANHNQAVSDTEWRKHMNSQGFKFPSSRAEKYELRYAASCKSAMIEHEIREFLDAIENELSKCDRILPKCSDKWRYFKLPYCINRNDIQSEGYKYGNFYFSLEQNQVINLLMGENLYESPYTFIRELLQNSIDTVRHRKFYEESKGNTQFKTKIEISSWYDSENYQWIRIDDNGMGMNESKILDYFLKVGKSFYNSSEFEVEKISYKEKANTDFTPISRFGIGILSCFIIGNCIELNTKHVLDDEAVRLGLPGLQGFYNLQTQKDHYTPTPMPCANKSESLYRADAGTSIAVRLDPAKTDVNFNIKEILRQYILFPSVSIEYEGEQLCELDSELFSETPFSEPMDIDISSDIIYEIEHALKIKFIGVPIIKAFCLNLSEYSPTPDLKGMFLLCQLNANYNKKNLKEDEEYVHREFRIQIKKGKLYVIIEYRDEFEHKEKELGLRKLYKELDNSDSNKKIRNKLRNEIDIMEHEIKKLQLSKEIELESFHKNVIQRLKGFGKYVEEKKEWISHNGIIVPTNNGENIRQYYSRRTYTDKECVICNGIIALSDSLRPNFTLARDKAVEMPWQIYSTVNLAYLKAIQAYKTKGLKIEEFDFFYNSYLNEKFIIKDILKDPYIGIDKEWASIPIIKTNRGPFSLTEIRDMLAKSEITYLYINDLLRINELLQTNYYSRFTRHCTAALVQVGLCVKIKFINQYSGVYIVDNDNIPFIDEGLKLFPPLFFVPYEESALLRKGAFSLNHKHPFSQWLIEKSSDINKQYPGILKHIKEILSIEKSNKSWKEDIIIDMNKTLKRLQNLEQKLAPPRSVYLKVEDFED